MANFEQRRAWISVQPAELTFSLIVTFYLTKAEYKTKNTDL